MSGVEIFGLTTVALFLKMVGVAVVQGYTRWTTDTFARPEDAHCYGSGEVADAERPLVDRAQRTLRNDLENIPIFLFLAWAMLKIETGLELWPVYAGVFVASRFVHTLTYLKPVQPYRTIAYSLGLLVSLAMALEISVAVL